MVDRNFGSMVFEDQGRGPAVVMVHGLGGTSNSFQSLMPSLSDYRVLRLDLPGAGRSAYRPGIPGMTGLVGAVKNAMQVADIENAHLVGHSMGTLICQYLAVQSPRLVASLTLFGAILEPPSTARDMFRERATVAREQGMTSIAETISTNSVGKTSQHRNRVIQAFVRESLMRQDPMGYAAHCEALSEATAASHEKIDCSTRLIAGEYDTVTPVAMSRTLATKIQDAQVEVIEDIGHWIMVEAPDRSAECLRNHLDELSS